MKFKFNMIVPVTLAFLLLGCGDSKYFYNRAWDINESQLEKKLVPGVSTKDTVQNLFGSPDVEHAYVRYVGGQELTPRERKGVCTSIVKDKVTPNDISLAAERGGFLELWEYAYHDNSIAGHCSFVFGCSYHDEQSINWFLFNQSGTLLRFGKMTDGTDRPFFEKTKAERDKAHEREYCQDVAEVVCTDQNALAKNDGFKKWCDSKPGTADR